MAIPSTGLWIGPARRHWRVGHALELPLFDGFPYLVTRVVPALYHIILLPGDASEGDLAGIARAQWRANRLETCLVTGPEKAWYISPEGRDGADARPPRGGTLITGKLRPPTALPDTVDLQDRHRRLTRIVDELTRKGGYMLGDLTKGGRDATADDVARLAGAGPEGMPRGLERCSECSDWRGSCLDPSPTSFAKVMSVHCRCENHNRCATCGQFLHERRLNANYYDPRDRQIWHVPGFSGLQHRCPVPSGKR